MGCDKNVSNDWKIRRHNWLHAEISSDNEKLRMARWMIKRLESVTFQKSEDGWTWTDEMEFKIE